MHFDNPVDELIHLYEDGAFNRREIIERLTKYTGSAAAAVAALASAGLANAQTGTCPAGIQVPENTPDLDNAMITMSGEGGPLYGYLSTLKSLTGPRPAVLVVHENRGLVDHIRDVTRRVARAGYVALGIDLLSRQGGTAQFTDPAQQTAAYGRTQPLERRADMQSAIATLRNQPYVQADRVGAIGFCAGGQNVLDLASSTPTLTAGVAFYGPVPASVEAFQAMQAALMLVNGELDPNVNSGLPRLLTALQQGQKRYAVHLYPGTRHAFHNDTGTNYDAEAACDAWQKTLGFFRRYLDAPRTQA